MTSKVSYFKSQYQLVQKSRQVLFEYCQNISNDDFLNENSSFGRGGSIRNLLVHIANTYEFWIVKNALGKDIIFTEYSSKSNVGQIKILFDSIDSEVNDFIVKYKGAEFNKLAFKINGTQKSTTPFELFTHVITHEFHHKGQILSLSRHLGYIPVDTDIIR
jgi:uncharacterized damage-inducible protein DinB